MKGFACGITEELGPFESNTWDGEEGKKIMPQSSSGSQGTLHKEPLEPVLFQFPRSPLKTSTDLTLRQDVRFRQLECLLLRERDLWQVCQGLKPGIWIITLGGKTTDKEKPRAVGREK